MTASRPDPTVRPARPADILAVERIEHASFDDPWSREALFTELMADAMRLPLVALIGDDLVGFLMAWRVVDQLHILNVATDPGVRRGGVGMALLGVAAGEAAKADMEEITLEVRAGNLGAQRFYERLGFLETGRRPGYYSDNREDAVIMTAPVGAVLDAVAGG